MSLQDILEEAQALDACDPLAHFRARFEISDPDLIYLDGNSLGRMPIAASRAVQRTLEDWGDRLIRGWGEGWMELPQRIGDKIARVVGAAPGEVLVSDSTTVNLYKLVMAAMARQAPRKVIVTDDLNFPSDHYVLQSCARQLDAEIRVVRSRDGVSVPTGDIAAALGEDVALVTLSHVAFKSGFMYPGEEITRLSHDCGALVLWDLSHAAGAVPVELGEWGADLAVGCTYKYLNGGPGAPAFLFVRSNLQDQLLSPVWGWLGSSQPFAFSLDYSPADGIQRFQVGTPTILALCAIEAGVDLVLEAGVDALRQKSVRQTEYLHRLWADLLQPLGVAFSSPAPSESRGSHVAFSHPEALRIDKALIERMKVIPDFRTPDNIRYGVAPLYTSYVELWQGIDRMARVIRERTFDEFTAKVPFVT